MPESTNIQTQVRSTATWNLKVPISIFSAALYRNAQGRIVQMPVAVAGDKITVEYQGTAQPQS